MRIAKRTTVNVGLQGGVLLVSQCSVLQLEPGRGKRSSGRLLLATIKFNATIHLFSAAIPALKHGGSLGGGSTFNGNVSGRILIPPIKLICFLLQIANEWDV